ncbi:MAG TPA: lipid-A-disaccharide synthase [Bacteroidota bacterium]
MPHRVLMVAGEASGDMHASGVVRALKVREPAIEVYGVGGDRMREEGMEIVVHIRELAFMGFVEVLANLATVRRVGRCLEDLLEHRRPDITVLVDYPGFNLRFARTAARRGIPVLYYISPQVWAWHRGRVRKMRETVRAMKVVFPFEEEIYRAEGIDVEFVGHPLAERIGTASSRAEFFARFGLDPAKRLLALLPGSRLQEIRAILPVLLEAAGRLTHTGDAQAAVGVAPNLGLPPLMPFLQSAPAVTAVEHATYDLMAHADAAIVTSGTATLETGWFGTPMVIVYKTSPLSYGIGRMLVTVPYIGLANIVAGAPIVPELIQSQLTCENLVRTIAPLLHDRAAAAAMRSRLAVIREKLGGPGASAKVAEAILGLVRQQTVPA